MSYPLTEEESRRRSVNVDRDALEVVLDLLTDALRGRTSPMSLADLTTAIGKLRSELVAAKVAKHKGVR